MLRKMKWQALLSVESKNYFEISAINMMITICSDVCRLFLHGMYRKFPEKCLRSINLHEILFSNTINYSE